MLLIVVYIIWQSGGRRIKYQAVNVILIQNINFCMGVNWYYYTTTGIHKSCDHENLLPLTYTHNSYTNPCILQQLHHFRC